ncbi:MAG: YabP/YqfC family sporulation protein [Clostridia bacterium]|nr:YabP/YqfC family sporulation protein [Clostridia bacterium]
MRLYEEIFKSADGVAFARYVVVLNGGGYFEGVKAVDDFSTRRIKVCFQKEELVIEGEDLSIKKYCEGDLQLAGKICAVYLSNYEVGKNADATAEIDATAETDGGGVI